MSVKKNDTLTNFAKVSEIFVSIQGEGAYVGQKQLFVRFAGCNLDCEYCDEPAASAKRSPAPFCSKTARQQDSATGTNKPPVAGHKPEAELPDGACYFGNDLASVVSKIIALSREKHAKNVSLTGGEPLLQWRFIKALSPALKKAGLTLHLETNGVLYKELGEVRSLVDVIAMDIKLPSATGCRAFWAEHSKFMAVAPEKTFVKVVVTSRTAAAEFEKAVNLAAEARASIPFFIQPASPKNGVKPPPRARLNSFYKLAALKLEDVRILPQMHKLWGIK